MYQCLNGIAPSYHSAFVKNRAGEMDITILYLCKGMHVSL